MKCNSYEINDNETIYRSILTSGLNVALNVLLSRGPSFVTSGWIVNGCPTCHSSSVSISLKMQEKYSIRNIKKLTSCNTD